MNLRKIRHIAALACIMAVSCFINASAQQQLNEGDRERIISEMRAYKHEVLIKALDLTKEQQPEFFKVYDEMDEKLMQINNETRELERKVLSDENASDTEVEAAAAAVFAQKEREGKIELEYFEKLRETVTPRQLLKLKSAEKMFTQKLIRHHRRMRDGK